MESRLDPDLAELAGGGEAVGRAGIDEEERLKRALGVARRAQRDGDVREAH